MTKSVFTFLFTSCLLMSTLVAADKARVGEIELQTEKVVVFKDGYFLIIKKGTATTNEKGEAFTEEVPDAAVLGSFWAVPAKGTIKTMTAGWVETKTEDKKPVVCMQPIEIIQANVGKQCSFMVGEETKLTGKIKKVLTRDTVAAVDEPMRRLLDLPTGDDRNTSASESVTQTLGSYFVLETDEGDVLMNASEVRQLRIDNMQVTLDRTVAVESKQKRLTIAFDKPKQKVEVALIYFRPGLRWIPTYRVNLSEDLKAIEKKQGEGKAAKKFKAAEVSLQGELINEAEDLIDMPIDLVVGVPNFRFRDVPSPLVLEGVMRNALQQATPQLMAQQLANNNLSNAMYTQRSSEFRSDRVAGGEGAVPQTPAELSAGGGNDLFIYHLPKMSLKKGERAAVPIMKSLVPYRDIYTWDILIKHNDAYAESGSPAASPLQLSENKVWRQVELMNDTKFPWTTGSVMFVDGFQPIAQELLTYTSPGGICRTPVTIAVDLRGKAEDTETDRKLNNLKWQGHSYARVDGKIEVELANNKSEPVPVEITLRLGGRADEASDEGKIHYEGFRREDWVNYRGDTAVNNSSEITWTATIDPLECFKPTVKYHFFTRH